MKRKSIDLKVKITGEELFSFLMKHTYTRLPGIFGLAMSLICLLMMALSLNGGERINSLILLVIGLLFTVINPIMIYMKARKQALSNPMYKNTLEYTLDEKGISLKVGKGKKESMEWDKIIKCVKTRKLCILYTSEIHAILLPYVAMGNDRAAVEAMIESKVRGK